MSFTDFKGKATTMDATNDVSRKDPYFFTFDPDDIINDVVNAVTQYVADGGDRLQHALEKESPIDDEGEIQRGCHQLVNVLTKKFRNHFNIFQTYAARNIFRVDPALHLEIETEPMPAHMDATEATIDEQEAALDLRIAQLRVKREQGLKMQQKMESELEKSRQFKKLYLSFVMDSENLVRNNGAGKKLHIPKEGIEQMLGKVKDLQKLRERQALLQKQLLQSQSAAEMHGTVSGVFRHEANLHLQNAFRKDHRVTGAPSIATLSSQALTT